MAGDTANSYFAEGMAEEVATALAKVPGLQLAGRNSASAHSGKSPQEIGKLLGVGAVLQGSVRRAGERMRVSVELTNATSGIVMWTESYEREVKDVFAVQDEISREIVSALRMKLGGGGTATHLAGRGTENMAAYDDYLRGVYQYQRRGAGVELAVKAFSDAIAKDSTFARAWAGLAQALVSSTEYADVAVQDVLPQAQTAVAQAVRLAPDLAEAHLAAGTSAMFANQWAEAEPSFRRAIELDSTLAIAHQFYARYLWAAGRVEDAVTEALMARTMDPLNAAVLGNLGPILTAAGRREEGFEAARRAFELDSTVSVAITAYAHTSVAAGKLVEARAFGERVLRYATGPRARGAAAYALGRAGDTAQARAVYDEMVRRRAEQRTALARARAMFGVGDTARALGALEEALQQGDPIAINFSFVDPMFDPVRGSERFAAVVKGYGLDPAVFTSVKR
jgi:serine/threonine-protein kinase